jgi:hypothetical protein
VISHLATGINKTMKILLGRVSARVVIRVLDCVVIVLNFKCGRETNIPYREVDILLFHREPCEKRVSFVTVFQNTYLTCAYEVCISYKAFNFETHTVEYQNHPTGI